MSNNDSFIDEVTEEVRRDRLFALMRRYGWIVVTAVVLLVGGAAVNEWQKARSQAAAQDLGDRVMAAMALDDPAARTEALAGIDAEGHAAALVEFLAAADTVAEADRAAAQERLQAIAANADLPLLYRDLAVLKSVLLQGTSTPADDRMTMLAPLAVAGAPFRLLAEEQIALILVENGETDAALEKLQALLTDTDVTAGLRRRVSQLIVALGGELSAA